MPKHVNFAIDDGVATMKDKTGKTHEEVYMAGLHAIVNSPFCAACKEDDCTISLDGTCAMIRIYIKAKAEEHVD